MPDPFDFISTRSEINDLPTFTSLDLPKADNVSLIPLVSADNRTNPETSVLDNIVNSVSLLPDNSPAYEYKAKEEKRYSNPYLQFTPDTKGRGDIENVYGEHQGSGEQLVNGIIKMGALAGATFISSYASIPSSLDLIRSGKAIDAFKDDATFSAVQNWTEGIEDMFPNYYTQWERDHPYLSIISPTGFANVWGDKVIKNIGFTVGGLAAGITQGAILEIATGGLGTPLAFMKAAKAIEGSFGSMIRGFRNLSKVGIVGKTDDVLRGLEYTKDSLEAIKSVSRLNQIRTGATLVATTYLSAQGEAFIEGYHTYIDTKKQLLEDAIDSGTLTADKLNQIEKDAMDAGRYTTGFNIPLLMASNLVQFPIILGGKAFGSVSKGFIGKGLKEGVKFTNDHTFRKGLKAWGKDSLKGFVSEGLEEGNQYFIGNSLHDYYADKIDPQSKKSIAEYMLNNIPKVLRDEQFQQEAFFGGLSGVAMGAPFARGKYFKTSKTQSTVDHLSNVYDNFNKTVKNFTHTVQLQDTTDNPDGRHNADIAHKALFSAVHDSLKVGTYDMHQDILEDMKHLSLEDFNKSFGTTFENENEKLAHVQGLVYESEQIKKDVINTNKYFMTNPFTQNKLLQKVKQAISSKSEYAIANAQERLFEDFKELAAFNQSRLRTVGNNLSDKITSLKTLGAKDESIQYLISIAGSPKGLNNYLQWKSTQLEALNKSVAYFEKMKGLGTETDPTLKADMDKEYKEATKRKAFLESYMSTIQTEKDQEKIMDLILKEETTGEQQIRFMEALKKKAKEAADLQAQQTNLEAEQEDLSSPDSQTAEELININQEVGEQNTPVDNEAELVPPTQDPSKWTQKFNQGQQLPFGDKPYTIDQVLEDALIVTDEKGIKHKVTQIDVNGQLSYAIDAITTSPTEQMQSQTNTGISDSEYNDFIDKGIVSQERLIDIANKVKNRLPLTNKEIEIFSDKTSEINKIIAETIAPTDTQEIEDSTENTIINNTVFLTPPGEENGYRSLIPIKEAFQGQEYKFYDLGNNLYAIVTDKITYLIDKNYPNKDGKYIVEKIYRSNTNSTLSIINKPNLEISTTANGHNLEERYKRLVEARKSLIYKLDEEVEPTQDPVEEYLAEPEIQDLKKEFTDNAKKTKDSKDLLHLGKWILENAKVGDEIRFPSGHGYKVTQIIIFKTTGRKEIIITPFEIEEDGSKLYGDPVYILSDVSSDHRANREKEGVTPSGANYDGARTLFESAYENNKGERVVEQSEYFVKNDTITTEQAEEIRGKKTEVAAYHPITLSEQSFTYQDIIDNPGSYFTLEKVASPSGKLYTAKVVKGKVTGEIIEVKFDSTMEKNKGLDKAKRPYYPQKEYKTKEFRQVLWKDSKALINEEQVENKTNKIDKIKEGIKNLGKSILSKLGYKNQNRLDNGNVKGGQDGWKIRFNIKNPKTGKSYYDGNGTSTLLNDDYNKRSEILINFLLSYFGSNEKADSKNLQKHYILEDSDGNKREPFKHLSGGDIGESDFTIYIGSADDVLKFISDIRTKHPEILELLHSGNLSDDVKIDDVFKGRIEGRKIGFSGYHIPTNLNQVLGTDVFNFIFDGKNVRVNYKGTNLSDIYISVEGSNKAYRGVFDKELKKDYPELYKNLRNIIGFQLYGNYLQGSNGEFIKLTEVSNENSLNYTNADKNTNYIEMFFKDNNSSLKESVLLLINKGMIKLEC